jgi:hypothetical protein
MSAADDLMPSEWHDWHDFYMLLGTASAALVALLFVAVIGASFLSPERSTATRTFMSPVVFHFSTLLIISLIAMVPSHTALSLVIGIAAVAIAGLGYTTVVLVGLARASISDVADRFGYGILPLVFMSRCSPRRALSFRAPHLPPISWPRRYSFSSRSIFAMPGI